MKKLLAGVLSVAFAVLQLNAGVCTWKGDASGNGAMSVPGNWEGSAAPVTGDTIVIPGSDNPRTITNDLDESVELDSVQIAGVQRGKVTFAGEKTMTLTGATCWASTNALEVLFPIILKPTAAKVTLLASSADKNKDEVFFRRAVTLVGDGKILVVKNGACTTDNNPSGVVHFYGPVTTSKKSDVQACCPSWSVELHFHDKLVTRLLYDDGWSQGRTYLHSAANDYDEVNVSWTRQVVAKAANVFAAGAPLRFTQTGGITANDGVYELSGFDQTANRLVSHSDGEVGNTPPGKVQTSNPATLTLRGTESARTVAAINGKTSVVWDPPDGTSVQTFAKRESLTSGSLTVRRGTVEIAEDATFPNLTGLVIENGAMLSIAEGTANPFGDGKVALEILGTGKIVVPDGMELKLKKIFVSGVPQAASRSFTSAAGWIEGAGTVVASETDLAEGYTYWAAPVSGSWTNDVKWTGGVPTESSFNSIVASGADYTVKVDGDELTAAGLGDEGRISLTNLTVRNLDGGTATLLVTNGAEMTLVSRTPNAAAAPLHLEGGSRLNIVDAKVILRDHGGTSGEYTGVSPLQNAGGTVEVRGTGELVCYGREGTAAGASGNQDGYYSFGTGHYVFRDNAKLHFMNAATTGCGWQSVLYPSFKPSASGDLKMEFLDNSCYLQDSGISYWKGELGANGRHVELIFDTAYPNKQSFWSYSFIGCANGLSEMKLKRGTYAFGDYLTMIGSLGTSDDASSASVMFTTGRVEIASGVALSATGWNVKRSMTLGHALSSTLARGQALAYGEIVTAGTYTQNRGSFYVGAGACGEGVVRQTGGSFKPMHDTDSDNNPGAVAIGIFGGKGLYEIADGEFKTYRNVFAGGATANDLSWTAVHKNAATLETWHAAQGEIRVKGGTFTSSKDIILGADGTGCLTPSGTGVGTAVSIVISNTVGQTASSLRFASDAKGLFGTIDPSTKLVFAEGSKLVIDATDLPADAKRQTLLALDNDIGGFDYIKDHVELVNAPPSATADWSEDGRRLRFGCRRGTAIILR